MGGFEEGGGWDAPTPPNFGNANLVAGSLTLLASGPYVASSAPGTIENVYYLPPPNGVSGVEDTAVQTTLNTVRLAGGGTVIAQPGVYQFNLNHLHPLNAAYQSALVIGAKTKLIGAGRDATIFRVIASQTVGQDVSGTVQFLLNYQFDTGDEQITIEDLTFDGNAVNQTHTHSGPGWIRVRGGNWNRVRSINFRGTGTSGPNETAQFTVSLSTDINWTDCEAIGSSGSTSVGFGAGNGNSHKFLNCRAFGTTLSNGFSVNTVQNFQFTNCHAYLNGKHGFNVEVSVDVIFTNCIGGGVSVATSTYPYASGTSLGNTQSGFLINNSQDCWIVGCIGRKNGNGGADWTAGSSGGMVGGRFSDNTNYGISDNGVGLVKVTGQPLMGSNGLNDFGSGGIGLTYGVVGAPPAPALPASGVNATNTVLLTGVLTIQGGAGTFSVTVDGGVMAASAPASTVVTVIVPPGRTFNIGYGVAPTLRWYYF